MPDDDPKPDQPNEQKPAKRWTGPRNVTGEREGGGLQIIGAGPPPKTYVVRNPNPTCPPPVIIDTTASKDYKGLVVTGQGGANGDEPPSAPLS